MKRVGAWPQGVDHAAFTEDALHDLIRFLLPRMPRYWLPRFVELAAELPRTESHKVRKAELRAHGITSATWDSERSGMTLEREAVR